MLSFVVLVFTFLAVTFLFGFHMQLIHWVASKATRPYNACLHYFVDTVFMNVFIEIMMFNCGATMLRKVIFVMPFPISTSVALRGSDDLKVLQRKRA